MLLLEVQNVRSDGFLYVSAEHRLLANLLALKVFHALGMNLRRDVLAQLLLMGDDLRLHLCIGAQRIRS